MNEIWNFKRKKQYCSHFSLANHSYVTELTDHIRIKSVKARDEDDDEEESKFIRFFPDFIWAVRDFTLERKLNGCDVSEDEYLDFALQLKKG